MAGDRQSWHSEAMRLHTIWPVLIAWGLASGARADDYGERMAQEHADDAPTSNPMSEGEPGGAIEEIDGLVYATLDGVEIRGFLARPAAAEGALPGILVIHEWWGLNDNIRNMARQLAGEGYVALAVDLYEGGVAEDPDAARALLNIAQENEDRLEENLRQALATLSDRSGGGPIGVVGWCFGGGWSLRTALLAPEQISAVVMYYGRVSSDAEELAALQSPLLGIFGAEDGGIPVEGVRAFESTLNELGKSAEIHVYEGADHAFANPSGHNYQAEAAQDAWSRTLIFFAQHLRGR